MRRRCFVPGRCLAFFLVVGLLGCDAAEGIRATPSGEGPVVRYDTLARPFPDMPFPNDQATRRDECSPTGRRVNVGIGGDIRMEEEVRRRLNTLDGFGTYGPITVSFDAPLDIDEIAARHQDNLDYADDAVFLVDITPQSPDFGRRIPLDLGRGNYPTTLRPGTTYHPADSRQDSLSLIFETEEEDRDGDGVLDPGEDTDGDGVLDHPNVWPPGSTPAEGLMTFYEAQTDTLLLNPLVPLRERTRYAVVLTERLVGRGGSPVRSPFAYVHIMDQTPDLSVLPEIFARWAAEDGTALSVDDVAFAWVFTTQTITADLVTIREGLYGEGTLGWLADEFPADVTPLPARDAAAGGSPYVLPTEQLQTLATAVLGPAFDVTSAQVNGLVEDLTAVDYIVQGVFTSPDFLTDDGDYVFDWVFDVDRENGEARVGPGQVWFSMTVPRATEAFQPPFPVGIYAHGFGMARVEFLGFAGVAARYGLATIGIDAWGHGVYLRPDDRALFLELAGMLGIAPFVEGFLEGRARPLAGGDKITAGGDTFSSYVFHTRDTIRQSLVDHFQLVRALRGFDGTRTWAVDQDEDGRDDLAGDFDGDGTVDAGGAQPYFVWGSSMGGIHTTLLGPLEPAIVAAAPVSGGGGLTHLTQRSRHGSVRDDTVMRSIGPVVVGEPMAETSDTIRVSLVATVPRQQQVMPIADVTGVGPGDRVRLENETKGWRYEAFVREDGHFDLHLKCDVDDRFSVTFVDGEGTEIDRLDTWRQDAFYWRVDEPTFVAGDELRSPVEGWGLHRGSPDLRRLIGLAQTIMDPGDPVNVCRHYFLEPLDIAPEGPTETNLLVVATLGDPMDPMDTHAGLARAAGILDYESIDPRYGTTPNDWLIENFVLEGVCGLGRHPPNAAGHEVLFDPDALDQLTVAAGEDGNGFDAPSPAPGDELRATVQTASGQSGFRMAHMQPCGKHSFFVTDPSNDFNVDEYMASLINHWFRHPEHVILDDACHEESRCPIP